MLFGIKTIWISKELAPPLRERMTKQIPIYGHSALTIMVDSGINLKTVQYIAGHKDITTTMKYVHLLGESLNDVTKSFQITP